MDIPHIDVDELEARLGAGATLIDVRQHDEHLEAHLPEAILIPLDQLPDRVDDVPADEVLVICRSGGRSAAACEFLASKGITATNVAGGMVAWIASGRPVGGRSGTTAAE